MVNKIGSKRAKRCDLKPFCIILMLFAGTKWPCANAGMAESLTEGVKYAGQMFGINTAADVADLVARAFSNAATKTSQTKPDLLSTFFQSKKPTKYAESVEDDLQEESQQQTTHQSGEKEKDDGKPAKENFFFDLNSPKIITGVLRMIGFDARKLGALALNALIMMAQAIGNTLLGAFTKRNVVSAVDGGRLFFNQNVASTANPEEKSPQSDDEYRPRELRSGSPIDWFLQNPTEDMKRLLSHAMNEKLTDDIVDMIADAEKNRQNGKNSAACVKMLMCKCSPFIWGMQKSLKKRLNLDNDEDKDTNHETDQQSHNTLLDTKVFYRHMPTLEEFREHSSICNERYGEYCNPKDALKEP